MVRLTIHSQFKDFVEAAREGSWRCTVRDVAVEKTHEGEVRHYVADVMVPPQGPMFVADSSRASGSWDWSESQATAELVTRAVRWLPGLAESSEAARDLLRELRGRVDANDQELIDEVLAVRPPHEPDPNRDPWSGVQA